MASSVCPWASQVRFCLTSFMFSSRGALAPPALLAVRMRVSCWCAAHCRCLCCSPMSWVSSLVQRQTKAEKAVCSEKCACLEAQCLLIAHMQVSTTLDNILHTPLIAQQRVAARLSIQRAAAASQQAQLAATCRPVICVAQHAGSRLDRHPAASRWNMPELLLTTKMLEQGTELKARQVQRTRCFTQCTVRYLQCFSKLSEDMEHPVEVCDSPRH